MLEQDGRIVAFASRALTDTESRYTQTECEAFAIVWACEHFDMYVRGAKSFKVISDHKLLKRIWQQKARPPLRIERWGLRLQPYKFSIEYRPGKKNPADYMSRHPHLSEAKATSREQKFAEHYVNFIAEKSILPAMSLEEVKDTTSQDKALMKATEYVRNGWWFEIMFLSNSQVNIKQLQELNNVCEELSCLDNVLLHGHKIVLPAKLCNKAISIAHKPSRDEQDKILH